MLLMAILPALLVSISALLSYAYRFTKTLQLNDADRKLITKAHAFAIETIQLSVLLSGIITMIIFCGILTEHRYEISLVHIQVSFCFALILTLGIYIAAILAIDVADNRVQLGTWRHPFQNQTLLLTRTKLLPWTVKQRFRRHVRQRAFSSPAAIDDTPSRHGMVLKQARNTARSLPVFDTTEPTTNVIRSRSLSMTFSPTPDSNADFKHFIATNTRARARSSAIAEKKEMGPHILRIDDVIKWRDEVQVAKVRTLENVPSASTTERTTRPSPHNASVETPAHKPSRRPFPAPQTPSEQTTAWGQLWELEGKLKTEEGSRVVESITKETSEQNRARRCDSTEPK
ncbi:hypothetical protein AC579_1720 [Pseudocercospora musae]|uniref:Uncharacterized protein n=1 Tax=Pseudocercospora musae TaxID=113226 RepID=A0A139ICD1_9PEZI|nr:hypothetical protein AC579_1720 [Pseudocercospora musae]